MEGFSIISYKDRPIFHFDYSGIGNSKEKILQVLKYGMEEMRKFPPKSVLVLGNFENICFDMDVVNAFKEERFQNAPYTKKIAVVSVMGVTKIAYEFISKASETTDIKAFESESEAKEWLVSD